MILPATCSRIVQEFDAQGWHRTGTSTDHDSARWLVNELGARGIEATLDTYPFTRTDPAPCSVRAPGWEVEGYPFSDSLLPAPGKAITGRIADRPAADAIAVVRASGHGQTSPIDAFRGQPWGAIIALMEGPGLTLRNQWSQDHPFGPPVVQVPASEAARLDAARDSGAPVTVRCGATRARVGASNVRARVPGRHPELSPIVVLTPRSGWWQCAGERGGGIAIWLEVASELRRIGLSRDVQFLATTGHELGFWGIQRHFERRPAAASHFWIHLGANIGARGATTVVRSSSARLLDAARGAGQPLGSAAQPARWELPAEAPGGEAQVVEAAGATYLSIVGAGFDLFHSSEDRWPQGIEPEAIARHANFVLELLFQSEPAYRI